MTLASLCKRLRLGRRASPLGGYENLEPFGGRTDFFTGANAGHREPSGADESFVVG
jgi:hypothetical protein